MSQDCVTILSSDNDDVQVIESSPVVEEKRRIPLQTVTGEQVFTQFLEKCKAVDPSQDMERVIGKLWKKFNQAAEEYTSSSVFIDLVVKVTKNVPTEPYYQLKLVADELNHNKKIRSKSKPLGELPCSSKTTNDDAENEMDPKTASHIKKLEKTLAKLNKHIQRLENDEVDWDSSDEENSTYIQVCRYKERLCQVYQKICELQSKDPHAERPLRKHIKFSGTNIPAIDKAIEKFYNDRREFPDYRDILNVVQKANEIKHLNLRSQQIEELALRAFQEFGKTLKKWRVYDDIEVFNSYCAYQEEDPASQDDELKNRLEDNKKKFGNRIDEVIDKYALKQTEENIQPEIVISDAQSEGSDGEEEEEEEPESDCRSRSSILELKSFIDSEDSDNECLPECSVALTDVRYTAEWEQYMNRLEMQSEEDSKIAATISKKTTADQVCLPPWLNRKRSLSDDELPTTSKKPKHHEYIMEPIPSTSKQSVPIVLDDYRHISEKDHIPSTSANSLPEPCTIAESQQNVETMSVDDNDVIEVISDSCEKVENEKESLDVDDKKEFKINSSDSLMKNVISVDICTEEAEDKSREKDTCEDLLPYRIACDVQIDEEDTEINTSVVNASSSVENLVSVEIQEVESQTLSQSPKASSPTQPESVISVDIFTEDNEGNAETFDTLADASTKVIILEESEPAQDSGEKENASVQNESSPVEEIANIDLTHTNKLLKTADKVTEKGEQTVRNSLQDNGNDEIMIIDEVVKTPPKTNAKKEDDVIDVEEIADSPQKPKTMTQLTLDPVNLTQIIRNMKFNKNVTLSNSQPKNRIPVPSTSRNDPRINKPNNIGKELAALINPSTSYQKRINRQIQPKLPNSFPLRPQGDFVNANQRKPLNNGQFLGANTRNLQQYFANNRNVTLQPAQASMQKRQCTTHTFQQQKFDRRTNSVVTRKQITTVVEESVMTIGNSKLPNNLNGQFQVIGQRTRVVDRRMQHIQRSTRSNINNVSEDVITLD